MAHLVFDNIISYLQTCKVILLFMIQSEDVRD